MNNQVSKDSFQDIARLRSKIRANKFYAIPWRCDSHGIAPDADREHGMYLKSFCDDAARTLAESCLRHYKSKAFVRDWDPLAASIAHHSSHARKEVACFVGRENEIGNILEFLQSDHMNVLFIYGKVIISCGYKKY